IALKHVVAGLVLRPWGRGMSVRDFVPHWAIALLFVALWLSNTESGSFLSEWSLGQVGTFILEMFDGIAGGREPPFATTFLGILGATLAYWLSLLFLIAFLFAYGYDNGWRRAVGLLLIAIVLQLCISVCLVTLGADESNLVRGATAI